MFHVVVLDLGAGSHHQGTDENDSIFALILVLLGAVELEQLVAQSGVKLLAVLVYNRREFFVEVVTGRVVGFCLHRRQHVRLVNHLGEGDLIVALSEGAVDLEGKVNVPVAFEQACE